MEQDNKCPAISKSTKKPCPYKGKHLHHDGKYYCQRHLPKEEKIYTVKLTGFPEFPAELSLESIKALQARISKGPTKSDEAGEIYIYYLPNDCYHYWKIGKTSQKLDTRMNKWSKDHGVRVLVKQKFKVKYVGYAERLIHLYLAHIRVHRYPVGKKFKTILVQSGAIVDDRHWRELSKSGELISEKKFIEWFMEKDIEWIIELIEKIIKAI